jgi:hypothetical protein
MGNDADTLFQEDDFEWGMMQTLIQEDEFEWGMMQTHCFRWMSLNGE